MSEAVHWEVKPWEWFTVPDYWMERIKLYYAAREKLAPVIEARQRRRQQLAQRTG